MSLTTDQENAIKKTVDWYKNSNNLVWKISGYAGVGKTFIIKYIVDDLKLDNEDIAFLSFTGKSCLNMRRKGVPAKTIHSTIYRRKLYTDEKKVTTVIWDLVPSIPYKLIIIDEVSMVDDVMFNDLISFGIKICIIGDGFQLPPISNKNSYFDNADIVMNEIVRQSLDNPIIYLSMLIREGKFKYKNQTMGDNVLITNKTIPLEYQVTQDIVLVGTHKMRKGINNNHRKFLGHYNEVFNKDEKVVCKMNNKNLILDYEGLSMPISNGMIGTITTDFDNSKVRVRKFINELTKKVYEKEIIQIDFKPDFVEDDDDIYNDMYICVDTLRHDNEKPLYTKPSDMVNYLVRGSAITVHAGQGSDFDKVLIYNDFTWADFHDKWLYTAITRAKEKCVLVF